MSDPSDANLQLKKRARRRLVGAFAFAGLAAVLLPMVMDEEPKQQVQDVQIRIPGQEQTPFSPKIAKPEVSSEKVVAPEKTEVPVSPAAKAAENKTERLPEKQAEKPLDKPAEKTVEKTPSKASEMPVTPSANDPARAAAILSGKAVDKVPAASAGGQFVILIGAFANPANVKQLQGKIGELGIKVFTEPLDSPEGKKTRVRAGPFPDRDAADKALDRMKRIGINGVIAARQ
jgi:DedD protein